MTRKLACRVAAGLLLFFACAHTAGMLAPKEASAGSAAVRTMMDSVHFEITGFTRSYGDFYFGFGMLLSTFLVFAAWLAWTLGGALEGGSRLTKGILRGLAACIAVVAVICWRWFFVPPAVVSTLAAALLGWAAAG